MQKIMALTVALTLNAACEPADRAPSSASSEPADSAGQAAPTWEVVAEAGMSKFVYMSPDGLEDKFFIAQVLQRIVDRSRPVSVLFFDERALTPVGFPMTDRQMLHWKAQYNQNPNTGLVKFVFIQVVDSTSSPPDVTEVEAQIRPGYAQ